MAKEREFQARGLKPHNQKKEQPVVSRKIFTVEIKQLLRAYLRNEVC